MALWNNTLTLTKLCYMQVTNCCPAVVLMDFNLKYVKNNFFYKCFKLHS